MKLIALSRRAIHRNETILVTKLFENGLDILHLRKTDATKDDLRAYLKEIPKEYVNRIMLHSSYGLANEFDVRGLHFSRKKRKRKGLLWLRMKYYRWKNPNIIFSSSFHTLESLMNMGPNFDYVFLSPIFDSISKTKYSGKFSSHNLSVIFNQIDLDVIALGGVSADKIAKVNEMGFAGAGILGGIWKRGDDPIEEFMKIKKECEKVPSV